MSKHLSIPAVVVSALFASFPAQAQSGKAPCGSFQKLPDGQWSVIKTVKIEHGNASAMINPGTTIGPGTRVAGADIYTALQQNCH